MLNGKIPGQKILKLTLVYARQGSFFSPLLFALYYIDDLVNLHCPERGWFILLYADDQIDISICYRLTAIPT